MDFEKRRGLSCKVIKKHRLTIAPYKQFNTKNWKESLDYLDLLKNELEKKIEEETKETELLLKNLNFQKNDSIKSKGLLSLASDKKENTDQPKKNSTLQKLFFFEKPFLGCPPLKPPTSTSQKRISKQNPAIGIPLPYVTAKCWVIYNPKTEKIIQGMNQHYRHEIASLTKIMTCLVTLNYINEYNINPLEWKCCVTDSAASMSGTSAELFEGEEISVLNLLYGLMLPSGNDAAWSLAENLGEEMYIRSNEFSQKSSSSYYDMKNDPKIKYPVRYFVEKMNEIANSLQLSDTKFNNPHGLMDEKNYSTAFDMVKLANFAMKNKTFKDIVGTKFYTSISRLNGKKFERMWLNTNKLLKHGYAGVKTGITNNAGACLVTHYRNQELSEDLIVCVINSKNEEFRFIDADKLTQWAFSRWNELNL